MGEFHQGAERLEHLARGQIDGGRKIGAPLQGQIGGGHFTWGRKIGAPCQGADSWGMV